MQLVLLEMLSNIALITNCIYLLIDIFACFPIDIKNTSRAAIKHGELLPPDHILGAHVEQDGHINKDYHHEVFLGEYLIFFSLV